MKKVFLIASILMLGQLYAQVKAPLTTAKKTATRKVYYYKKTALAKPAKKYSHNSFGLPAINPQKNVGAKQIVYQYVDSSAGTRENFFPNNGNIGIGTNTPQAAVEIKRNAGDTRTKNILLQLSNEYSPNGQNEPSIMFSNGDVNNPNNVSYWTVGARVSGDEAIKTPQTFKVCYKDPKNGYEQEYFSIDSYQGRVKIGDVSTNYDGYKLYVEEGILTEKIKVAVKNSTDWFDNVFEKDYNLMPLNNLGKFVTQNKHLPDVPTTNQVLKDGVDLGKMNGILLKKVEELTLYILDLKKELDATRHQVEKLTQQKTP